MCGLFFTSKPDEYRAGWQERISRKLLHRGPDAQVAEERLGVGAVHTRLAVIGLGSPGSQPMSSVDQSDLLVFNGEIVNYRAMARERGLELGSDTRLLLQVLAMSDYRALSSMRGMFAFVYWNSLTRELTAMRDRYGVKPLFALRHVSGGVSFASEMRSLMEHPDAQSLDPVGVANFLAEGHTGPTRTVLDRIQKLLPGVRYCWQLDDSGKIVCEKQFPLEVDNSTPMSTQEALIDSVENQLVADVEVGVFLSGGVDSTLIAALASREQSNLQAFTLGFPESVSYDETEIARHNAALMGLRHHVVEVQKKLENP